MAYLPQNRGLRFAFQLSLRRTALDFGLQRWPAFDRRALRDPGYKQWRYKLEERRQQHYADIKNEDIVVNS